MAQQLFQLLKKDHRLVEQLMDKLVDEDPNQRQELFDRLDEALSQHLKLEDKFFYPRLRNHDELKDLVEDAIQEHREAKDHLLKLNRSNIESEHWLDTLQQMQEGILHHIEDEEEKIFPHCSKVLSDAQLKEIGQEFVQAKEQEPPAPKKHRPSVKQPGKHPRA